MVSKGTFVITVAALLAVLLFAVVSIDSSDDSDAVMEAGPVFIPVTPHVPVPDSPDMNESNAEFVGNIFIPAGFNEFLDVPDVNDIPEDVDMPDVEEMPVSVEPVSQPMPFVPVVTPHLDYAAMLNMAVLRNTISCFVASKEDEDEDEDLSDIGEYQVAEETYSEDPQEISEYLFEEIIQEATVVPPYIFICNAAGAAVGPIF